MLKFFRYLHYRLYAWGLKTWGEKDMPQWNALIGVTFLMISNLGLIALGLHFLGFKIFLRESTPRIEILLLSGALFILNYFLFLHNGKYLETAKEFSKEPESKRSRNTFLLWIYALLSITMPFCIGLIYHSLTT